MQPGNFHRTANPFNLADPPESWLWDLFAFDTDLVIFQSLMHPNYRIVRKTKGPGIRTVARERGNAGEILSKDTLLCYENRWVPVTSLHPQTRFSPLILQDLAERDITRYGGHEKFSKLQEDLEAERAAKEEANDGDDAMDVAGFAWRSLKWANGETIDAGARKRARDYVRSGFRRVAKAIGDRFVKLSPAEEAMVIKVDPPAPKDQGLIIQP